MGIWEWVSQNWFDFFTSVGIIGGLWFTAVSIFLDAKARRVANLLTITRNHREIWKEYLHNGDLARILDANADLEKAAVTDAEQVFVTLVIIHTSTAFYAMDHRLVVEYEGLRRDIAEFFSLPIPKAVWLKSKPLQNHDFADFIESCQSRE
jgi:hypothetical protein